MYGTNIEWGLDMGNTMTGGLPVTLFRPIEMIFLIEWPLYEVNSENYELKIRFRVKIKARGMQNYHYQST
jgi:hypothetical protein